MAHSVGLGRAGDIPANLGMQDMLAALRWVQKEIAAFGGDADRVMIWGESAGGRAVGSLLGSPLSKGLFRRAVCISGSSTAALSPASAAASAAALAEELGIPYAELTAEALQAVPIEKLRQAMSSGGGWGPVVAPPLFPGGISPIEGLRLGLAGPVDVMSGTNRDEANLQAARRPSPVSTRDELEERVARTLRGGGVRGGDSGWVAPPQPEEQAKRIVDAIAANPKPWWNSPDDVKGDRSLPPLVQDADFRLSDSVFAGQACTFRYRRTLHRHSTTSVHSMHMPAQDTPTVSTTRRSALSGLMGCRCRRLWGPRTRSGLCSCGAPTLVGHSCATRTLDAASPN